LCVIVRSNEKIVVLKWVILVFFKDFLESCFVVVFGLFEVILLIFKVVLFVNKTRTTNTKHK